MRFTQLTFESAVPEFPTFVSVFTNRPKYYGAILQRLPLRRNASRDQMRSGGRTKPLPNTRCSVGWASYMFSRIASYIFLLTGCWIFRQARSCAKSVRRLPRAPPDPLPAGLTAERKGLVHTTKSERFNLRNSRQRMIKGLRNVLCGVRNEHEQ